MTHHHHIGAIIRQRRLELGLTQEQLAERVSGENEYVRQAEISRLESGKVGLPRRPRLERISAALEIPTGELLAASGWARAEEAFQESPLASPAQRSEITPTSGDYAQADLDRRLADLYRRIAEAQERTQRVRQRAEEACRAYEALKGRQENRRLRQPS